MVNLNCSFRSMLINITLRRAAIILLLGVFPLFGAAQNTTSSSDSTTPAALAPGSPAGSFVLSGFDTISPFSGKINFKLPLLHIGGRGKAGYTMTYDFNQIWQVDRMTPDFSSYTYQWASPNGWTGGAGLGPGFMAVRTQAAQKIDCVAQVGTNMDKWSQSQTRLTFTASDGTEYEFLDALNSGAILTNDLCVTYANFNHRGRVWVTRDGSSATFITDSDIYDNQSNPNAGQMATQTTPYAPVSGMMILRDGTKYRIDNGAVSWIRDTNGNKVTFTSTATAYIITDSLGRQVTISGVEPVVITYKGVGGADRQIKIYHNTLDQLLRTGVNGFPLPLKTTQQLFPSLLGSATPYNPSLVSYIELPDGRKYQFKYNYYSELARVELPTGGAFEYDWGGGPGATAEGTIYEGYYPGLYNIQEIYRRVNQRRVYKEGNVLESQMVFTAAHSHYNDPRPWTTNVKVEEKDATGNVLSASKHYYYGSPSASMIKYTFDFSEWNEGKEYQTETLATDSLTVLRRTNMTWQQRAGGPQGLFTHGFFMEGANDPRMIESTTALTDVSPNLVSKQTHKNPSTNAIGYDQYNNPTDVWEYDFGSGAPGSFLRYSHTDYVTSGYDSVVGGINAPDPNATVHIRGLPLAQRVYSDSTGSAKKAETLYEYDNYSAAANYAPLINRVNISGLDTISTTMRGNVTKSSRWRNTDNAYINTYAQYDIAGNVVKTIDANGNPSTMEYDDRFGAPNGEAQSNTAPAIWLNGQTTFAFPTKVTNAKGHIAYTQFDYYLGKPVDTEDPNGIKNSLYYNDALDRPTQARRNVTSATAYYSQMTISYDDTNHVITSSSDKVTAGDNALVGKALYDGLGRTWRKAAYENADTANPWIITETQFDGLGRAYRATNPFRGNAPTATLPGTPDWTTSTFDALGRVTKVIYPDNPTNDFVETRYSGNAVTVIDQAKKVRRSIMDGLGRLIRVDEPNRNFTGTELAQNPLTPDLLLGSVGSPTQSTSYSYDVLDDLLTVNQGVQTRTFVYDSLKRLISSDNPEWGTLTNNVRTNYLTTYEYDNNGNLKKKTDGLGRWIQYNYDQLNRNYETYSNDPSTVYALHIYDGATNGKGRLWYTYTSSYYIGSPNGGQNLDNTTFDTYDALGRPISYRQNFAINNGTAWSSNYTTSRTYDLAGNVLSQTYPSGRTVNYAYNTASQMTSFTGDLGDGTLRNYAKNMAYTPAGQLTQEQFGMTSTLYHNLHYNKRQQLYDIRLGSNTDGMGTEWTWNRGALRMFYNSDLSDYGAPSGANNNGNIYRTDTYVPTNDAATTYTMSIDYYGYDHLNRLTGIAENKQSDTMGETGTGLAQYYVYDRYGNRTVNNAASTFPVYNSPFTVNTANNRLQSSGNCMTYDAVGNLINDCGKTRSYDANNKMRSAVDGSVITGYRYNADGHRTVKSVGSTLTWYIYGMAGELIAEYPANTAPSTPQIEYGYRGSELLIEGGCDAVRWRVTDQIGNTRMSVGTAGTLASVKRTDTLPFGEEIGAGIGIRATIQGYSQTDCWRQKFTGKERDIETLLDYFGSRYYANVLGRFTSIDPIPVTVENFVNPQRWNQFAYSLNSPLTLIDPTGGDGEGQGGGKIITVFLLTSIEQRDSDQNGPNWENTKAVAEDHGNTLNIIRNSADGDAVRNAFKNSDVVVFIKHGEGPRVNNVFIQTSLTVGDVALSRSMMTFGPPVTLTAPNGVSTTMPGLPEQVGYPATSHPDVNAGVVASFSCSSAGTLNDYLTFTGTDQSIVEVNSGTDGYTSVGALELAGEAFVRILAADLGVQNAVNSANDALDDRRKTTHQGSEINNNGDIIIENKAKDK